MNIQLWKVAGFLAALLAASTAFGQLNRVDIIADVPFAFTVANHTLPPGRSTVTRMGDTTLRVFNSHNQGTLVLTTEVDGKASGNTAKMVFHRYGDAYFLSEVWVSANWIGRKVFQSRAEKELAGKRTEMELAVLQVTR
jgi:hypothetical protein